MSQTNPLAHKLEEMSRDLQSLKAANDASIIRNDANFQTLESELQSLKKVYDTNKLAEDVEELESRLQQLKASLTTTPGRSRLNAKKLAQFLLAYWTLIAVGIGLITALFVYAQYGVGYFESYKKISDSKKSAEFYKQTGDSLIPRAEFKAAEIAYTEALSIDPYYVEARKGLMRSQILNPLEGYKTFTPVVVEARLNYLEQVSPDDYLIPYFRGILRMERDDQAGASKHFFDSQKKEPGFAGNYIQLGYLDLFNGRIDPAAENFRQALARVPDHPLILNYLGMCEMLKENFSEATKHLAKARGLSPRLETLLNLGEAYRDLGDLASAAFTHEEALHLLANPDLKEGMNYGLGTFNYMPLVSRPDAAGSFEQASSLDQYRALANYALSIDYALQRKFSEASEAFDRGYDSDRTINGERELGCFYLNRIDFATQHHKPDADMSKWFAKRRAQVDANNTCK